MPRPSSRRPLALAAGAAALLATQAVAGTASAATTWSLRDPGAGRVDASGALLWSDGTATTSVRLPAPGAVLVLRADADLCGSEAPEVELSVDGVSAGRRHVVNAASRGAWDYPFTLPRQVAAGTRQVAVRFLNDHQEAGCDRNVRLRDLTVTGGAAAPAPTVPARPRPVTPSPTVPPAPAPAPAAPAASPWQDAAPFAAAAPYADPTYTSAARAAALRGSDPSAAAALDRITRGGVALWVGDWNPARDVAGTVRRYAQAANAAGRTGVVVTYAVPGRDCGSYSAGGLTPEAYGAWSAQVAEGLRGTRTAVVVEPDAIAQAGQCAGQGDRLGLLRRSVEQLRAAGLRAIYLDAGNSGWTGGQVPAVAQRLRAAGVEQARGFAVNVSNFQTTDRERAYGEALSRELGGARYVVDTSRNGAGGNGQWCNPAGRKLGATPGAVTDGSHQDANLWVKRVGESDGTCGGGPAAGTFWTEYAIALAR